jgi:RNA polymerase sigma-70 factor (ECF subfamily)
MQDTQQFTSIILEHRALIYKVSRVYVDDSEDQKDLYQEIVYQLWKSFGNFKGNSKISTWMYRVAMNTAIAFLNKSKRNRSVFSKVDFPDIPVESTSDVEVQTQQLYQAIKLLNIAERGIILLYLEGKNYKEVAEITGYTESNIGTRMARIKQKLKELIKS